MKLTNKQKIFCTEYLVDLNGKQAAIRAGYSDKTAEFQASRLLSNVKVQEHIQVMMDKRSNKIEVKAEDVLEELKRLSYSNIADYLEIVDGGVVMKDFSKLTREQTAAIESISETYDAKGNRNLKFKLYDKKGSLELLGKHLVLFTDKIDLGMVKLQIDI